MEIRKDRQWDWFLVGALFCLSVIGLILVYSATYNETTSIVGSYWFKQLVYFALGVGVASILRWIPLKYLKNFAVPIFLLSLVLLAVVALGAGTSVKGAGRWISLGGFRFQPSEFAKIAYLIMLSSYMVGKNVTLMHLSSLIKPFLLFIVPFALILKQPDLSTALVFVALTLVSFYWSGMRKLEIFILVSPVLSIILTFHALAWWGLILTSLIALWRIKLPGFLATLILILNLGAGFGSFWMWNHGLKDHQRSRILTFIDPLRDPKGEGYQVIQSEVAIGSGGFTGKGFLNGSQTNLSFLPEEHTDFIFSVLGEQFGLFGCSIVLFLYCLFFLRILRVPTMVNSSFGGFLCVGVATILAFHTFVNIAMTLGMMPVTGLPLPFMSYGGSFVLTCMVLVGIVFAVQRNENH